MIFAFEKRRYELLAVHMLLERFLCRFFIELERNYAVRLENARKPALHDYRTAAVRTCRRSGRLLTHYLTAAGLAAVYVHSRLFAFCPFASRLNIPVHAPCTGLTLGTGRLLPCIFSLHMLRSFKLVDIELTVAVRAFQFLAGRIKSQRTPACRAFVFCCP